MSIANDIINKVKQSHGVSEEEVREQKAAAIEAAMTEDEQLELLKKYGYNALDDVIKPEARPAKVEEEEFSSVLPTAVGEEGYPTGGVAAVKFEDVAEPAYFPPVYVPPTPAVVTAEGIEGAWQVWRCSRQGMTLCDIHNMNMQRLHAIIPDRIEAAFRAGFAAGDQGND